MDGASPRPPTLQKCPGCRCCHLGAEPIVSQSWLSIMTITLKKRTHQKHKHFNIIISVMTNMAEIIFGRCIWLVLRFFGPICWQKCSQPPGGAECVFDLTLGGLPYNPYFCPRPIQHPKFFQISGQIYWLPQTSLCKMCISGFVNNHFKNKIWIYWFIWGWTILQTNFAIYCFIVRLGHWGLLEPEQWD